MAASCSARKQAYDKVYKKAWRSANKERLASYQSDWRQKTPHALAGFSRRLVRKRKAAMMALFGTSCEICGCADGDCLTLDHKNGDGAAARRAGDGPYYQIVAAIMRGDKSVDNYRLLCWNCNCSTRTRRWSLVEAARMLYCRDDVFEKMALA